MVGLVGTGARALACMLLLFDLVLLIQMYGLRTKDWPSGPKFVLLWLWCFVFFTTEAPEQQDIPVESAMKYP
jgi:hypothetical protein